MSFETAMAAIEECTRGEENCGIIFFGGEPLLEENLIFGVIDECERRMPLRFHWTGREWPGCGAANVCFRAERVREAVLRGVCAARTLQQPLWMSQSLDDGND